MRMFSATAAWFRQKLRMEADQQSICSDKETPGESSTDMEEDKEGELSDLKIDLKRNSGLVLSLVGALGLLVLVVSLASMSALLVTRHQGGVEGGVGRVGGCSLLNTTDQTRHRALMIRCERNREAEFPEDRCPRHALTVLGAGPCLLRYLLVGGGGGNNGEAGAGSGLLTADTLTVVPGTELVVKTGEQRRHSVLKVGELIHSAGPGGDAPAGEARGGGGYSGGGGAGGWQGGAAGAQGGGDWGGGGSGLDVTKLQFSAWNITPGAGGAPYRHGSIFCRLSCFP